MEIALYCPKIGYYEQPEGRIGRRGDFYTSVSVGPLFGQLLAFQFANWAADAAGAAGTAGGKEGKRAGESLSRFPAFPLSRPQSGSAPPWQIVEGGAHDGNLAADILAWLETRHPGLWPRLQYTIVEPSPAREAAQRQRLDKFAGRVSWVDSWQKLPAASVNGVLFANELLDAFPIHRLGWDAQARRWFEWGVVAKGNRFEWTRMEAAANWAEALAAAGLEISAGLAAVLPDGFTVEISPDAMAWWEQAAGRLGQGRLMTLDYGLNATQFLAPERKQGTLRAYRKHAVVSDPLADPGQQDLTAHVNFTHLQRTGEAAGLETEAFVSQSQFLTRIAQQTWNEGSVFDAWSQAHTRQFQTLTHPGHLGDAFRVMIQSRGNG